MGGDPIAPGTPPRGLVNRSLINLLTPPLFQLTASMESIALRFTAGTYRAMILVHVRNNQWQQAVQIRLISQKRRTPLRVDMGGFFPSTVMLRDRRCCDPLPPSRFAIFHDKKALRPHCIALQGHCPTHCIVDALPFFFLLNPKAFALPFRLYCTARVIAIVVK